MISAIFANVFCAYALAAGAALRIAVYMAGILKAAFVLLIIEYDRPFQIVPASIPEGGSVTQRQPP